MSKPKKMRKLTPRELENLSLISKVGLDSSLLELTATGLKKSILDATSTVRAMLAASELHDYSAQQQGPINKIFLENTLYSTGEVKRSRTSLYRPLTKDGDPRIWFYGLKDYARAGDILAVIPSGRQLITINLTRTEAASFIHGPLAEALKTAALPRSAVADELLGLLRDIAARGPLKSVMEQRSDTAIGRTIEDALGIPMNSGKAPDYKGIELKSARRTKRAPNRSTLFAQVPDWSRSKIKSSAAILEAFGYERGEAFKLNCTISGARVNSQGLSFEVDHDHGDLWEVSNQKEYGHFAVWNIDKLKMRLATKHAETFWIKATPELIGNQEWYHLDHALHTQRPLVNQLDVLLDQGVVTMDHLISRSPVKKPHERGPLFKINPRDLELLFPPAKTLQIAA